MLLKTDLPNVDLLFSTGRYDATRSTPTVEFAAVHSGLDNSPLIHLVPAYSTSQFFFLD